VNVHVDVNVDVDVDVHCGSRDLWNGTGDSSGVCGSSVSLTFWVSVLFFFDYLVLVGNLTVVLVNMFVYDVQCSEIAHIRRTPPSTEPIESCMAYQGAGAEPEDTSNCMDCESFSFHTGEVVPAYFLS
jgi:hypothetical protein